MKPINQSTPPGVDARYAMCEAGALFGLVDLMVTGNRYYFVVMMTGALGILLHFPRRDHLLGATYKNRLDRGEPGE